MSIATKGKKTIGFIFCSAFYSYCSSIPFMIKGINQNHVTHPYIIANISTNILSGCFLCCKQRIKDYFCMLINLPEEWAGNSISPESLSTKGHLQVLRFWVCLSPLTFSPVCSLWFIFTPGLFAFPFNPHLMPAYPLKGCTLLCPLINSLHKRYQDSWYSFLPVMLSPQPLPFSCVYL